MFHHPSQLRGICTMLLCAPHYHEFTWTLLYTPLTLGTSGLPVCGNTFQYLSTSHAPKFHLTSPLFGIIHPHDPLHFVFPCAPPSCSFHLSPSSAITLHTHQLGCSPPCSSQFSLFPHHPHSLRLPAHLPAPASIPLFLPSSPCTHTSLIVLLLVPLSSPYFPITLTPSSPSPCAPPSFGFPSPPLLTPSPITHTSLVVLLLVPLSSHNTRRRNRLCRSLRPYVYTRQFAV
jgi:hypothetical protein